MSLAIEIDQIEEVLLSDGWHRVVPGTLELDAYEYVSTGGPVLFKGGQDNSVSATGFTFLEQLSAAYMAGKRRKIKGPLSAILGIREKS
jgi:hypothetical protein